MTNKKMFFVSCIAFLFFTGCASNYDNPLFGINFDRRTTGTIIDDHTLSLKLNNILTRDRELWNNCHINVITYNNTILLVGQAQTIELKTRATDILQKLIKSKQIYNNINIDKPTTLATRAKDSWITSRVKAKILSNKYIGINRVKVVTEDGIVYLIGILNKSEENLVEKLASNTPNVKQVIKIITNYNDESIT